MLKRPSLTPKIENSWIRIYPGILYLPILSGSACPEYAEEMVDSRYFKNTFGAVGLSRRPEGYYAIISVVTEPLGWKS